MEASFSYIAPIFSYYGYIIHHSVYDHKYILSMFMVYIGYYFMIKIKIYCFSTGINSFVQIYTTFLLILGHLRNNIIVPVSSFINFEHGENHNNALNYSCK